MKHLIYILLPLIAGGMIACNSSNNEAHKHDAHEHETHQHEAHEHEALQHEDHDHEGHEHEADEHGHKGHSDEIILHAHKAQRFGVATSIIEPSDFSEAIKVSGKIYPEQSCTYTISATKSGVVNFARNINLGSPVKAHETIATISANGIIGGDAEQSAKITLENAEREFQRVAALYEDRLVTERDYLAAKEAYEQAKNSYKPTTEATRATSAGTITAIYVSNGQYVETGTPIATVSASNTLMLCAYLPERYGQMIVRDANFKPSYSETVYSVSSLGGRLAANTSAVSPTTGYIPVYFTFTNKANLVANSYAEVYLLGTTRHNVISLPVTALTEEQGDYFVYEKIDEEGYIKHMVTLGMNNGNNVEILSGITSGMEIVTEGAVIVKLASNSGAVPGHSHQH